MRQRLTVLVLEIWLPIVLVGSWWILSSDSKSFWFPPLRKIVEVFRQVWLFAHFRSDFVPSVVRFGEGLALSIVLGVSAGVVLGLWSPARRALSPTLDFIRSIPATALVSTWIVLLGFGNLMKITAIVWIAFFPILLNTIDGVRAVDPHQLEMARAFKIRRRDQIFRIVMPAASPQIFVGLRIGLAVAILMMAFGEMFAGTNGIGYVIYFDQQTFRITEMWSAIIVLGLVAYAANLCFVAVERRVLRWHRGWRATARESGGL
jgi:sulfonate transport system permease protein